MEKLNELEPAIRDLRTAAAIINTVADNLAATLGTVPADEAHDVVAPTTPVLKLESVRAVLSEKSRAGFTVQIRALLQKYGAEKLSAIDPANYKSLLTDVEELSDAT